MTSFILVEPQMGENIGACARVMANFGFDDLRIVNPRDGWPNEKALAMSAHASHIIENAQLFNNLADALYDINHAIALTARQRNINKKIYNLDNNLQLPNNSAFIFGAERTGLSNDDIALCSAILTINTDEKYSSLNLAQSVAIIAHHFSQISNIKEEKQQNIASQKEKIAMAEHLISELQKTNFFQEENKKPVMIRNITNIFTKVDFSMQEVQTLRGIFKSLGKNHV
jgi:tRNA/rRNA methyltransferase